MDNRPRGVPLSITLFWLPEIMLHERQQYTLSRGPRRVSFFFLNGLGNNSYPQSSRPLEDGDIVNIDVTVYLDGHHGDTSRTFLVGDVVSPTSFNLYPALHRLPLG